jgi:hypothetical protein
MRKPVILLGVALLAACNVSVDDGMVANMENSVRETLDRQGTVKQIELTRDSADRISGHALVELDAAPGADTRFTCVGNRREGSETTFDWECTPPAADK